MNTNKLATWFLKPFQKLACHLKTRHPFWRHPQRGTTALEYVLILAVIVIVIVAALIAVGFNQGNITAQLSDLAQWLS